VLISVATLVAAWVWAVIQRLVDADSPFGSAPLWQRVRSVAIDFYNSPISFSLDLLKDNTATTILALILIASYVILFILLRRSRWILREVEVERVLAMQAGLGGRWSHAKISGEGGAPWADLCAGISRHDNSQLLILGANGIETFGRPGSPLFDVMQNFRGSARIILIDPNSSETAGRASALGVSIGEYRRAIVASTKRLRDLRQQQHPVDWRYYDGQPNWKMIITSRTA